MSESTKTQDKKQQITKLLIDQAHQKLSSGVELSASDLKVCLDISKAYGIEEKEKPKNIIENLPFDELEKDQNEEEKL
jgi:hypothetical protein